MGIGRIALMEFSYVHSLRKAIKRKENQYFFSCEYFFDAHSLENTDIGSVGI